MDKRGKRVLSTAIQDRTLKNHWVRKKTPTNKLAPYLRGFPPLTIGGASENTDVVSLLGGLRFTHLPQPSVAVEGSEAQPLASAYMQNLLSKHHTQPNVKKK